MDWNKLKNLLADFAAIIYFLAVMMWVLLLLALVPIIIFSDISIIFKSGFATSNTGTAFIGLFGLAIGISMLIPAFRRMYYKLPWMFPFVKIMYLNVIIMSVAVMLLNYGYEVQSPSRHKLFVIIMICQIIVSRILMCIYFYKRKVRHIGGRY